MKLYEKIKFEGMHCWVNCGSENSEEGDGYF